MISVCKEEISVLHDQQDSIYLNNEDRYEVGLLFKELQETLPRNYFFEECFAKKVFLKVSENSRRRTCAVITFFDKVICCWAASCGS